MNLPQPTSEPVTGAGTPGPGISVPIEPAATASSRSRMLAVGVPAVLIVAAVGGVTFLMGSGDDTVRTGEVPDTATTSTSSTTVPAGDVFTASGVTVESAATTTTSSTSSTATTTTLPPTTSTTLPPTATLAPTTTITAETLPEQPSRPIAPPADPRGAEDQIQLGGVAIPKLGVDEPLLEDIRLTTLDNGPGHWPGTAMPGEIGNVVVAAHRTSHGGPFRNIDQLVAGDVVVFTTDAGRLEYSVTSTQIVEPDAIWIVDPTDTATATLFACHPPGSVTQRIVVKLDLAS